MATQKIAITMEKKLVDRIDRLVEMKVFPNRSRAIQEAVTEKVIKLDKTRLTRECSKLDSAYEQSLAEEGIPAELESWPKY
jgi:metal-responsive CopG/Arc/MetJ family transcriptional regulator